MIYLPEQKNLLDTFQLPETMNELKNDMDEFFEQYIIPYNLHKVRGLSGREYRNSPVRRLGLSAVSLIGLVITAPVSVATALAIKIDSPHDPLFYTGSKENPRLDISAPIDKSIFDDMENDYYILPDQARQDIPYTVLKFRSMQPGSDIIDYSQIKAERCPEQQRKITRPGRIARLTKADELPQLFSSAFNPKVDLISPRPILRSEMRNNNMRSVFGFNTAAHNGYINISNQIRPGIAGLPMAFSREELNKPDDYKFKVHSDLAFDHMSSIAMDEFIGIQIPFHIGQKVVRETRNIIADKESMANAH